MTFIQIVKNYSGKNKMNEWIKMTKKRKILVSKK